MYAVDIGFRCKGVDTLRNKRVRSVVDEKVVCAMFHGADVPPPIISREMICHPDF